MVRWGTSRIAYTAAFAALFMSVLLIDRSGTADNDGIWNAATLCSASAGAFLSGNPLIDFLAGNGAYLARTHCMVTQEGGTDWTWVWLLVGLNALVIAGYLKIFVFWRKAYLQEEEQDRNKKLMELAWIFLFCACCGYISSIMLFFWPGYRLLALALVPLAFFTWKFAANLEGFRISLSAKRLARELNESLQQQNERLSREVELATMDLQAAKAEAERANIAKSEFLARMSHEIRTPLTSIMGYVDIAIEESQDNERAMNPLLTVHRNSEHLLQLINDVLDVSKIEAGEMGYEFVPSSFANITNEVFQLLRPKAELAGTQLHVQIDEGIPDQVLTDPTRMRQLIMNLVGNAIKFTNNGQISVSIEPLDPGESPISGVRIRVCDTGIGMSAEQAEQVFEKFAQGGSDITRRYGGTGLGLTISKQIVQDMGGTLTVSSTIGEGSEFIATIKCSPAEGDMPLLALGDQMFDGTIGEHASLVGKRILLVEDGEDNVRLIRYRFKKIGVEIEHAEHGEIAHQMVLAAAQSDRPYDMVIMDINMPVMDGIESLCVIRSKGCEVPVMMLSAHAMVEEQRRSYSAGASAYCCKPIDFELLFTECERLLVNPSKRRAG